MLNVTSTEGTANFRCEEFRNTVDGQNPAPPRMMIIPLFIGF